MAWLVRKHPLMNVHMTAVANVTSTVCMRLKRLLEGSGDGQMYWDQKETYCSNAINILGENRFVPMQYS